MLAADSAVEKDGAVTERKHFPMNLNRTGFVVFSVSYVFNIMKFLCIYIHMYVYNIKAKANSPNTEINLI